MPSLPWSSPAPQPDPTAEALFEQGVRALDEKKYIRAIDSFQKIKTDHPFSPLVTQAELRIADAYYLNQQYPDAINAFKEFQALHPTNEHIAFVVYRLGQAHLDQFTSIERDQKNTEIAKGYFENVIRNYPQSPYAGPAREHLAKAVGYIAEHEFNIASFYLKQEKYPAARDRFEEIVRKYPGTPVAARSLFFLGESYRKEKNSVKAALAYEALLQHYPESKFAPEAKTTLAQLEKEKQDPLAMLLMRDGRPAVAAGGTAQETATSEKLKNIDNLTAKTEIVYEEPGGEKGIFTQVADKLNPFSSSDDEKKARESPTELAAKKKASGQEDSPGVLGSLWNGINPFGGQKTTQATNKKEAPVNTQLVNQIDDSLKQKGIDAATQTASLKPPPADMPKVDSPPPQTMDTTKLLGDIDAALKESGKNVEEAPAPPEAHPALNKPATTEAVAEKTKPKPQLQQDGVSGGLLSSIDEKLKSQGFEPAKIEAPPTPDQLKARQEPAKKVELEPKVAVEKGPLFLGPAEIPAQRKAPSVDASASAEKKTGSSEEQQAPAGREFPRTLVKGPTEPQPAAKTAQQKPTSPEQEDESIGALEKLKSDIESARKALNPFSW